MGWSLGSSEEPLADTGLRIESDFHLSREGKYRYVSKVSVRDTVRAFNVIRRTWRGVVQVLRSYLSEVLPVSVVYRIVCIAAIAAA